MKLFVQVWILRLLEWLDVFLDNIPRYSEGTLYRYGDWGRSTVGRVRLRLSERWDVNSW